MDSIQNKTPLTYAAYTLDESIRNISSSGGIFSELAKHILEQNGVVFGCALNEQMQAGHRLIDTQQDLHKLQGSKYVQSDIGKTYIQCAEFLKLGRKVLFSGTPCQIEGLYRYLECVSDRSDMENLYTQDLICHGVPSPGIWSDYLNIQKKKRNDNEFTNIKFRDKSEGWSHYSFVMEFSDGSEIKETADKSIWSKGFLSNLYLRPSCYECKCKKVNRKSDITLADFWGIEHMMPELSDDRGVSLVMVHSPKGSEMLENIRNKIYLREADFTQAVKANPSMIESAGADWKKRNNFFRLYSRAGGNQELEKLIVKYTKKRISSRMYFWFRRQGGKVLRKAGLK